ncbi:MAG: sterol desaturase family protein [Chthoniobacterales bacterium]|nr:sterol desaturase family protein [Chthoniobacterales bacterium]
MKAARERKVPGWLGTTLLLGAFGALVWLENRRPLRRAVESKLRRNARNLAVATLGAVSLQLAEQPVVRPLTRLVESRRLGLLKRAALPAWLEVPLAIALLDYTLYLWHVLTHRVPLLWRFHQAHHADRDMDASTALRFHFGELLISVPWRAAQILTIGVCPLALSLWQTALLLEIMFHHSNVELPPEIEARLANLIVTPRLHGIHHSIVEEEVNSNWSSGLTIWDRLHRTLRVDVPQNAITIGVPAFLDPAEVKLGEVLEMPFVEQRDPGFLPPRH